MRQFYFFFLRNAGESKSLSSGSTFLVVASTRSL